MEKLKKENTDEKKYLVGFLLSRLCRCAYQGRRPSTGILAFLF